MASARQKSILSEVTIEVCACAGGYIIFFSATNLVCAEDVGGERTTAEVYPPREAKVSEILSTAATRAVAFSSAMCAILRWCAAAKLSIACFIASEKIYIEGSTEGDGEKASVSTTAFVSLRFFDSFLGESILFYLVWWTIREEIKCLYLLYHEVKFPSFRGHR